MNRPSSSGSQSTPGDPNDPKLTRYGTDKESAARLGRKAEEAEKAGLPHGVSTTTNPKPGQPGSTASKSDVEKHFPVQQTGNAPNHHTVVLPKPVTQQIADLFNKLFGR